MSPPPDVERGTTHDGIVEFDNPLPRWWLISFFGAIAFGFAYWTYFHIARIGLTGPEAYLAEQQAAEATRADAEKRAAQSPAATSAPSTQKKATAVVATTPQPPSPLPDVRPANAPWYWSGRGPIRPELMPPGAPAAAPAEVAAPVVAVASNEITDASLLKASHDQAVLAIGSKVFATTCVACHGQQGEGRIGPNLTDAYWLHGGKPSEIYHTVTTGVPDKGMLNWLPVLGPEKTRAVVAYVISREGLNLPGKAPQGERVEPSR